MAGQFCFCGDVGRGVDVGVGEDAGCGLLGGVGGVFFVVDGDAGEQGLVEDASFGWFALGVKVVEVDKEVGELVQACSGLGVGVGEVVEPVVTPPTSVVTVAAATSAMRRRDEDESARLIPDRCVCVPVPALSSDDPSAT